MQNCLPLITKSNFTSSKCLWNL